MSWKAVGTRLYDKLLYDLLKVCVIFLLSSSGALASVTALDRRIADLGPYRWPLGLAILAVLLVVGYWVVARLDRSKPWFRRIRYDFRVITKEVEYTYLNRTNLQYVKRLTLKANRHGLDRFIDKFNWSGRGRMVIVSLVPEHIVEILGSRNIWRLYAVNFGRTLRKGETIEIAVRWDLEDANKKAIPFFSQSVNEPTGRLSFFLRLPESFGVRAVTRSVLPTIDSLAPLSSTSAPMTVRHDFSESQWVIKRPRLLHCYQVSWIDPEVRAEGIRTIEERDETVSSSTLVVQGKVDVGASEDRRS